MTKIILTADVGGAICKLGIFTPKLEQLHKWSIHADTSNSTGRTLLRGIYDSFVERVNENSCNFSNVPGIGIGVPGPVDFERGIANGAVNLYWPEKVNVREIFEQFVDCSVYVDSDTNIAALREKHEGVSEDADDVVATTLSTGLGGGVISNDEIVHSHNDSNTEIDHFRANFDQRFKCNCGRSGCTETVAPTTGVVNLVNFYYPKLAFRSSILELIKENRITAEAIFDAAKIDDQFCIFITKKVTGYVGYSCSIISITSSPEYIIPGGGMPTTGPILTENIKAEYYSLASVPTQFETEIVQAKLGSDAGITRAAGLIKTYILDKEGVK